MSEVLGYVYEKKKLWARTNSDDDFLDIRIGSGNIPLKAKLNAPREHFDMEEDVLKDELAELTDKYLPENGVVLDAGCGEGFYTSALYEKAKAKNGSVSGVDISKFAVKAAAGKYKGIDFAVASLFHLPCAENSADVLTDVFAPIVPEEFFRVLKPGGVMILAVPGARHLYGMKEVLYKEPYENEEHDTAYDGFEYLGRACVQKFITVNGQENIEALFSMTPYYWKTDVEGGERLRALDVLETEIKFDFLVYRKK